MAKLTAQTAITAITDDDLFYMVNDPGGAPASRKITAQYIRSMASGTWANKPASPPTGYVYYPTDLTKPVWYTGTTWKYFDGTQAYSPYVTKALGYSPVAFWPLTADGSDESGNNYDGTISGDAVIQAGTGVDGDPSLYFPMTDDYFDVYSAGLASAWNGDELCIGGWFKQEAAALSDGNIHDLWVMYNSDSTNTLYARSTNGNLNTVRNAGTQQSWTPVASNFAASWTHVMLRCTVAGASMQAYINGVATGINVSVTGNWSLALASTGALWGASAGASKIHEWFGWMQYVGIFPLLSAAQILDLATI